jgi:hypothetical protein
MSMAESMTTSPTKSRSIFFMDSPFRSRWFFWRTLEFLLPLSTAVVILVKYWSKLTEHMANSVALLGLFMLVFPYRNLVKTCNELRELCYKAETWDDEHKSLVGEMALAAQRAMGTTLSNYFFTAWLLLLVVAFGFIRKA